MFKSTTTFMQRKVSQSSRTAKGHIKIVLYRQASFLQMSIIQKKLHQMRLMSLSFTNKCPLHRVVFYIVVDFTVIHS